MQVWKTLAGFFVSRVGRGGDDTLPVGMALPEANNQRTKQMNLADADTVEPDAGFRALPSDSRAQKLAQHAAAVFAGGQGLVDEPGGNERNENKITGVKHVRHGSPFPRPTGRDPWALSLHHPACRMWQFLYFLPLPQG